MRTFRHSIAALALAGALGSAPANAATILKLATMAPDGSIWMQALADAKAEIETATAGAVKVKIYPGGIMGSEQDVLFKIKTGQLHGGGFLGYAIGVVCPDAGALMFPMVFRNYDEVDRTLDTMRPFLDARTRAAGFETLGWTEVGFSYAYSSNPSPAETLPRQRSGLDSAHADGLFAAAGIASIPATHRELTPCNRLARNRVRSANRGRRRARDTKIRYGNALRLTYAVGGVFLSGAAWNSVPAAHRETVRAVFDKHCRQLTPKVRQSDVEALDFMRGQGIQILEPTPETRAAFEQVAATALQQVKGQDFSAEVWDLLQQTLREIRGP